jgi:hypothetical protein
MVEIASYIVAYPYVGLVEAIKDAIEDRATGYGECCFSIDGDELSIDIDKDAYWTKTIYKKGILYSDSYSDEDGDSKYTKY